MSETLNNREEGDNTNQTTPWDGLKEVPYAPDVHIATPDEQERFGKYLKLSNNVPALELVFDATQGWRDKDRDDLSKEEQLDITENAIKEFMEKYPTKEALQEYRESFADRVNSQGTEEDIIKYGNALHDLEGIFYKEKLPQYEKEISIDIPEEEIADAVVNFLDIADENGIFNLKADLGDRIVREALELRKKAPSLSFHTCLMIRENVAVAKSEIREDNYRPSDIYDDLKIFYSAEQAEDKEVGLAEGLILQASDMTEAATFYGTNENPLLAYLGLIEPELKKYLELHEEEKKQGKTGESLLEYVERELDGFTEEEKDGRNISMENEQRATALSRIKTAILFYNQNYKRLKAAAELAKKDNPKSSNQEPNATSA